ncbi:histidine phosphatase family protein [Sorangium sp. So ce1078]|uniref:histidine phosphatase family protein n=1 Tax=Sorangium sp. So ce1078 TaxID=3133329 RepID=UPI003F5E4915
MSARIILVRHGRSGHVHTGWIDAAGFQRWRDGYDAAGLAPGEIPPPALRVLAMQAGAVVSSDLPRARASAELLVPGAEITTSPLLRELDLPVLPLGNARVPLAAWALAIGLRKAYGALRAEAPPAATQRQAGEAAAWLIELAAQRGSVLAVTHGWIREVLARALADRGWRRVHASGRYAHWSAWTLTDGRPSGS